MPMGSLTTPGIYVQEVPAGPRPIEAVGTSIAAFVGEAQVAENFPGKPQVVNNWSQYVKKFMPKARLEQHHNDLSHGVYSFFENGGSFCYVVNMGGEGNVQPALDALRTFDEVAIVAAPGMTDIGTHEALLTHCELAQDRVAILDIRMDITDVTQLTEVELAGDSEAAESGGKRSGAKARAADDGGPSPGGARPRDSIYGTAYWPWIQVLDLLDSTLVFIAPSGAMAGIWARVDGLRGVHKAPANEPVRGAVDLSYRMTRDEQGLLNSSGVNGIRAFAREGIRVWGARTLADDPEWRYLSVRRLFNMVEESIEEGTNWIAFEPNDRTLWKHVRRDVGAFLTRLWRDGALMGATPEEAFYVKCDEETNPPDVVDAGELVAQIGLAPVKPAEFIVFEISQSTAGAEVTG
jgi:uncharacterized protein